MGSEERSMKILGDNSASTMRSTLRLFDQVDDQIDGRVESRAWRQIWDQVWDQVEIRVHEQITSQVCLQTLAGLKRLGFSAISIWMSTLVDLRVARAAVDFELKERGKDAGNEIKSN